MDTPHTQRAWFDPDAKPISAEAFGRYLIEAAVRAVVADLKKGAK